ncbi:hypothetical protein [Mongoliibacter ruber]|uniref:Uncharacterized protein n=1 Tax=Mongoliibacter ruber TaxID=1750599 RepID=A0A2T0WG75_9BACT|nr:hypothetical protein [Mongoliibacter ruber]PRY85701.1 hypothetical protein CLW00_11143 [Mongoliibacter ruber]
MLKYAIRIVFILVSSSILSTSCTNILDFEEATPCPWLQDFEQVRVWNSVDGLVRFDTVREEYFIVARFPGDDSLSVLRACNIPSEYLSDRALIRFFGNEYLPLFEEFIEEEDKLAQIVPFEITYIETVRK